MDSDSSARPARISGHPLLRILVAFPIAYFTGALVTDIVYWRTAVMMWADFSAWLLAAGMVMGVIAAFFGFIVLVADRRVRRQRAAWLVAPAVVVVLALALLDNLIHSRDAWTSVVPTGIALSAVTVIAMLATAWFGFAWIGRDNVNALPAEANR